MIEWLRRMLRPRRPLPVLSEEEAAKRLLPLGNVEHRDSGYFLPGHRRTRNG
jgi:hypothetical protein